VRARGLEVRDEGLAVPLARRARGDAAAGQGLGSSAP
jgi:hypothetical protein